MVKKNIERDGELFRICRTCDKEFKIKHAKAIFVNCGDCRAKRRGNKMRKKLCESCNFVMNLKPQSGKRFCKPCALRRNQKSFDRFIGKGNFVVVKVINNLVYDIDKKFVFNPINNTYIVNGDNIDKEIYKKVIIKREEEKKDQDNKVPEEMVNTLREQIEDRWKEMIKTVNPYIYSQEYLAKKYMINLEAFIYLAKLYGMKIKKEIIEVEDKYLIEPYD